MATWHQSNAEMRKRPLERSGCSSDGRLGLEMGMEMSRRDGIKVTKLDEITKERRATTGEAMTGQTNQKFPTPKVMVKL